MHEYTIKRKSNVDAIFESRSKSSQQITLSSNSILSYRNQVLPSFFPVTKAFQFQSSRKNQFRMVSDSVHSLLNLRDTETNPIQTRKTLKKLGSGHLSASVTGDSIISLRFSAFGATGRKSPNCKRAVSYRTPETNE
ncbi:hypothetical protein TNCV_979301 [Trichonephila clavipes]|nr:hypothetical protein TNCV_979301 [Trichonephila clavipes]